MSISIQRLSLKIKDKILLNNINCDIPDESLTILIGPNGAGKSTLLKVCSSHTQMQHTGSITINNKKLSLYSPVELAKRRAVMTQDYSISFDFTVGEIVTMGCYIYEEQISTQEKQSILDEVMTLTEVAHLNKRQFNTLSGGEQQRVQLARVIAQLWYPKNLSAPRYLFLDEPTSSLDIYHQHHILSLAKKLTTKNITVMAVIHDLSLAAIYADNLMMLTQGEVVAVGTPEKVLSENRLQNVYQIKGRYFHDNKHFQPSVLIKN